MPSTTMLSLLALTAPLLVMGQDCISLSGSTVCPAFNRSSVSTSPSLVSAYPFLAFVSSTQQFDDQLNIYVSSSYAQLKYQQLLGCSDLDLQNTTDLYARYTTSVICNSIVQNSREPCSLSDADARPLCADSCAQQAISEQQIIADDEICRDPGPRAMDQIRADFTVCSLPSDSLSDNCVTGSLNEPNNCGYSSNLVGLCAYCAKSSPNATDTCCYNSNLTRCEGVRLPTLTALPPLFPSATAPANASNTASGADDEGEQGAGGLSGGQIAGIVVGSVVGFALLLGLLILLCLAHRKRRGTQRSNVLNQPSPPRRGQPAMAYNPIGGDGSNQQGYDVLPGSRIARMSALEGPSAGTLPRDSTATGGVRGSSFAGHSTSSDDFGSPESRMPAGREALFPPPLGRKAGSMSSGSIGARRELPSSPRSGSAADFSSPAGVSSQPSEQLASFKDYYSQDEIRPNDRVATLWAYQPRAPDEFELERGDMLKIVGIWDDGWATGVRINERAEDWNAERAMQRDSGMSNGSAARPSSPPLSGEIKAFPLVCVCLPQHWKKTVEGEGSSDVSPADPQPSPKR
ncbi:MAG: hypothetical protein M1817_005469 [Caeruleum heppii]|nr:MAG: hypothetical protein M1817_005469 [Caeruleum heppii]